MIFGLEKEEFSEFTTMYIPMFVEQLMIASIPLFISSTVKDSGMAAVAAVNLLNSLIGLLQQAITAFGVGTTVVVSQFRGRGDLNATGRAAAQAVVLAAMISCTVAIVCFLANNLLLSMIFQNSAADVYAYGRIYFNYNLLSLPLIAMYTISAAALRGSGFPRVSLIATLIHNLGYAAMAHAAVHWFGMGLNGVGMSLMISRGLAGAVGLWFLKRGNANLHIEGFPIKINMDIAKPMFRVSIPLLLEQFIFSLGRLVTQTFAVPYGTSGMAAAGIANNMHSLQLVPGSSSSNCSLAIVGRYLGKGDLDGAQRKGWQFLGLATALMTISSITIFLCMKPMAMSSSNDPVVLEQVYINVMTYCIAIPFLYPSGFVAASILRSSGDGKFTSMVVVAALFLMRIPLGYFFTHIIKIGIVGIWYGQIADWLFRTAFFLPRFWSKKWLRNRLLD